MADYANRKSRRVRSLTELKGGDHIMVVGQYTSYYHHLLVVKVIDEHSIQVIHKLLHEVKEEVVLYKPEDIRVLDYTSQYTGDTTIQRAQERVGKEKYNLFTANCEHFVTEIRTGKAMSTQIKDTIKRMIVGGGTGGLLGGGLAYILGFSTIVIVGAAATGVVVGALATGAVIGYIAVQSDQKEKEHKD